MSPATYFAEVLRLFTAFLLLVAAFSKASALPAFRSNLEESFGVAPALARALAPGIAAVELLLAAAILVGDLAAYAAMTAALLMFVVFTAVVGYKFATTDSVKCSCFGEAARAVSGFDLLRNVLVMAGIVFYLALAADPDLRWPALLLAAGLASFLTVLAAQFHLIGMLLMHAKDGPV